MRELERLVRQSVDGEEVERLPRSGYLPLSVPGLEFDRIHWRV